jgi:hypothetical protein
MSERTWKEVLRADMDAGWADEIDIFEGQVELRKQAKIDEKVFAETRLRRGVYGQRYDNGQRADGLAVKQLAFPDVPTKGPETIWDAPGMTRIKIPFGGVSPEQLEVLADCAEEYSDGILHVTTRQDYQLHFVHIEDTPDLMRRLAAVGITTREACGNSVRNVTACPRAGVCHTETFDVSPYSKALMLFLLGHPDVQDFGRKMKPAFSGCQHEACGLVQMHDVGYVAKVENGKRGFSFVVGGGLGPVPHDPGGMPGLRAPRGEEQPRSRSHQVPGGEARHRGVPTPRRRGAQDPSPRRALDGLPEGHAQHPRRRRPRAGASARWRASAGLRRVVHDQRLPPAPGGLRAGIAQPAPG